MLRVLAESFVVSPPSGVTIKTRLRPTPAEEQALREVGTFLGSLYRADLVTRLSQGKLDAHGRARSRKVRKKYLTAQSSSRWAGSITRATQDQYDLAVRALAAERARLPGTAARASGTARPGAWPSSRPAWAWWTPRWRRAGRVWSRAADGSGGPGTTWRRQT